MTELKILANRTLANYAKAALLGVCILLPTQSFAAYTCSNPAICIAVCGAKTCGRIASSNVDMKHIDAASSTLSSAAPSASSAGNARAKPYTCSNPAICIAVCGKKTCG